MSKDISCFIRFRYKNQNLANVSVRVLNTDIRATTDEQGIAELRLAENTNELILVALESEEYIESSQTCFSKQYQDKNNPYTILTQQANFAITNLTIYKEQTQDSTTKQIPIYTIQPNTLNSQEQSINDNTQTHTTNTTDSKNIISLQAHIQTLKGGKMSDIQWGYYIKQRNENLKSKIIAKELRVFTFTSKDTHKTKVSFDINAKFKYTITENNTQKEVTDYLKDNQQLIIFAYRNSPAYTTSYGTPYAILTISQYPILKLTSKTLTILYTHTNTTYTLKHSCDTHYLSENLKCERIYTLECRESSLYIKDKESNKDIALMLTKEIPNIQERQIILDSKDLQTLQTILGLHKHKDTRAVYVEVELSRCDRLKKFYLDIHNISQKDMEESRQRIGTRILQEWVNSNLNRFGYSEMSFIKAEIRYYKIKGAIYSEFMKSPYNYINTCSARMSKALVDFGIPIRKLQGMDSTAYIANAGTNTKPYKILVKVKDMIDFLKLETNFGSPNEYSQQNSKTFYKEFYTEPYHVLVDKIRKRIVNKNRVAEIRVENERFHKNLKGKNGIVAMQIESWGDAWGHITLWDNDSFIDKSSYLINGEEAVFVKKLYFWGIE